MNQNPHFDRLREEIAEGKALAIIGAGISIGATRNARAASWSGLLEDGTDRCQALGQPPDWVDRVRAEIRSGDIDDLLSAAEKISRKLGAPHGEFRRWLRESVGALKAQERGVLDALRNLGIPLATTNYDGLLEETTGLAPVTWSDGHHIESVLRGDERGILHLHGHWDTPESVVLGIRSYEEVRENSHTQAVLRALRTLRTLIFIGCGEGLFDPNFGRFLTWTRECFAGTEYPHYRLCREGERVSLLTQHPIDEPIVLLSYGMDHSHLAAFLQSLTPVRPGREPVAEPSWAGPRLPPFPRCFGRDDEVGTLSAAVCADPPRPVPILGSPGIGKTTVTVAALHNHRVAERFGSRRWFIRCEGTSSRDALIGEIAAGIGLQPAGGKLEERVFRELEQRRATLVLDNADTPWERDQERVEELLAQLGGLSGLALVASIRGDQRPLGPNWTEAIRIGPLSLLAARDAFAAVAGERFRNDPTLDRLLEAVDRLPLAVTLLASEAEADPDLSILWTRWQHQRTELLRHGPGTGRLTSLEVSLEISITSPRMTEKARRLLTLLGILPDGINHEDLPALIPEEAEAASTTLRQVGLAFSPEARLRVLAPVRDHVARHYPPSTEDLGRVVRQYLGLAELGKGFGTVDGAVVVQRLSPELGNLEATIDRALKSAEPLEAMDAVEGLAELVYFTGLGTLSGIESALDVAERTGETAQQATCLLWLGDIALRRSHHNEARDRYEKALHLFEGVDSISGLAKCRKRLGDIAIFHSDLETAQTDYEEALRLYRSVAGTLGEANCIKRLGDIALRRSDLDGARACYDQALLLYRSVGSVMGEANCIKGLGDIGHARADDSDVGARYEEALGLYRRVGDVLGEANCIESLGDTAFARADYEAARARYEEALPLFRRVGDTLSEGQQIQRLGDIALARLDRRLAKGFFEEALALYSRIQEPYAVGSAHVSLARIAESPEECRRHIKAAQESWRLRPELLADLNKEFGSGSM